MSSDIEILEKEGWTFDLTVRGSSLVFSIGQLCDVLDYSAITFNLKNTNDRMALRRMMDIISDQLEKFNEDVSGVHSCHDNCQKSDCVKRRRE